MLDWLNVLASRIHGLFARRELDKEFQQELEAHLEMLTDENIRKGLPPDEARRAARLRLGGTAQLRETHRELWGVPWLETFVQDVRFGLRQLRRNPGFTAVAIITLALGIGANSALFSIVNELFLRPLPVENAGQLVVLATCETGSAGVRDVSYPDFLDYRADTKMFSGIAAYDVGLDGLSAGHWAKRAVTCYVTGNYFSMLQLRPALGRLIQPGEGATPGADPVIVLGYSFWKRQFGGDDQVVGEVVRVNGRPITVIGVAPRGFHGTMAWAQTDAYLPLSQMTQEGTGFWTSRGRRGH